MKHSENFWLHFTKKDCKENRNFAAENPVWFLTPWFSAAFLFLYNL